MGNNTYFNEEELKQTVHQLARDIDAHGMCHMRFNREPLPRQGLIKEAVMLCRELLFPGFFGDADVNSFNLEYRLGLHCERLKSLLENQITAGLVIEAHGADAAELDALRQRATAITAGFIAGLPQLRTLLHTDVEAIYDGDPAAVSREEVIYCYPAVKAITNYRIAHALLTAGVPVIPRMISEQAHSETGIDIHPGAQIGDHFAIDHGTGVVIGATAIIGSHVKLYQGVTLGARSFPTDANGRPVKGGARHPIIGNNVVVYSNATILGRVTIGDNAVIGGNIWVTTDVARGERLIQAKANNIVRLKNDD